MSCEKCQATANRAGRYRHPDAPCDICNDTGTDYIGRACRHCRPEPAGESK